MTRVLVPGEGRPPRAVLVAGLLGSKGAETEVVLAEQFGPVAVRSDAIPFDFSDYYDAELGPNFMRQWVGFRKLINPGHLVDIKLVTNGLERESVDEAGRRRVNIDPGVLSQDNFVLATTKPHSHRVYLGRGIYAEVTLVYRSGGYRPLEWTYPDYHTSACQEFLLRCRRLLRGQPT